MRSEAKPVTTTASASPTAAKLPSATSRIVRSPSTVSSVFGSSAVSSPSRRPAPAASTIPIIRPHPPVRRIRPPSPARARSGATTPRPRPPTRRPSRPGPDEHRRRQRAEREQRPGDDDAPVPARGEPVQPRGRHLGPVAQPVDQVVVAERQRRDQRERGRHGVVDRGQPRQRRVLAEPHERGHGPVEALLRPARAAWCPSSAAARPRRRPRRPSEASRPAKAASARIAPTPRTSSAIPGTGSRRPSARPIASATGPSSR